MPTTVSTTENAWPGGASQMAQRVRAYDWASTPLGAIGGWPQSLKTAVDLMLACGHAMQLAWGPQRTILYNDAYAPMLGERHPRALGLPFSAAWPDIWAEIEPLVDRVFAGRTVRFEDMPLVMTRHGYAEDTWWNFSYSPVRDESGAVAGLLNVTVDATAKHRAEEAEKALRDNEERLRVREADLARVQRIGRVGGIDIDVAGGLRGSRSPEYLKLHGLPSGLAAESHDQWLRRVHPGDREKAGRALSDALAGNDDIYESEYRIVRPSDGAVRWIHARADIERDPEGKAVRLVGAHIDVTDQKTVQEALRKSEERLRQFGEASQDVLWIRDAGTLRWIYLTPAFEEIYGISRDAALGAHDFQTWTELIVPEDREQAIQSIARVRAGERAAFEYRIRRPADGEIRWLRNTDFPITDDSGQVTLIGGVGHDITQIKAAEHHQKVLLAELQHRVRNTLAVIRSIIRRTAQQSETLEENTAHLEGRINAFARVQAVVTRDPAAGIDLASILADELAAAGGKEGDNLTIEGVPLALTPKAAETIGLAVHELTTNAVKYGALTTSGGHVAIRWTVEDGTMQFSWLEKGLRNLSRPPRKGFGTEILEQTLPYELKASASLRIEPTGLRYEARMPLASIVKEAGVTESATLGARQDP